MPFIHASHTSCLCEFRLYLHPSRMGAIRGDLVKCPSSKTNPIKIPFVNLSISLVVTLIARYSHLRVHRFKHLFINLLLNYGALLYPRLYKSKLLSLRPRRCSDYTFNSFFCISKYMDRLALAFSIYESAHPSTPLQNCKV